MTVHDYSAIAELIRTSPPQCGDVRAIGIDGPAGSGKTTLAAGLSAVLDNCPIVHMDDIYDGWFQDFETQLGNRLIAEILEPLSQGNPARYKKYDWHKRQFTSQVELAPHPFVILEGVGACNSVSASHLCFQIWIEADPSILIDRIIARDGEAMRPYLDEFKRRESVYFANQAIKEQADLHLLGD